ncbi:MAG: glutathione reductase (NADPH) [Verrucomicrobiales bacterium]|jgi:glutathione reductase (NADPH)
MNKQHFDAIVIGSGSSAYFAITGLNKAGKKVAVIDEREYGGTCALRGCQPKKYLVANAEAVAMASHLVGKGLTQIPKTDWPALQDLANEFLDGISEGEVEEFNKAGIATFNGSAQLTGANEVTVGEAKLTAEHIVLATGAVPRKSTIPGAEHTHDSEHFLRLPSLPERIVFIGGGYISFEFAHIAARAGAKEVTIIHRSARPLKAFDHDMVDVISEASKAAGISIILNEESERIEKTATGLYIHGKNGSQIEADLVIEASGRVPNLSVLDGDHAKVDHSPKGILVDQHLRSVSNPNVYAIGDAAANPYMLAPVADEEGKVAAHNILYGNSRTVDYSVVPSAVFTIPNLATVGLTEDQATAQGLDFRVNRGTTTGWPSSRRIGETHSGYKVLINNADNTIIGAHLARHLASETINIFALAIRHGIRAAELSEFLWAYPTYTSDLKYMVSPNVNQKSEQHEQE